MTKKLTIHEALIALAEGKKVSRGNHTIWISSATIDGESSYVFMDKWSHEEKATMHIPMMFYADAVYSIEEE